MRSKTLLYLLGFTFFLLGGCGGNKNQNPEPTPVPNTPDIISFTPVKATTGQTVNISGSNFTGATAVSFGGTTAASITVVNATTITAVVGSGDSGDVKVTTPNGSAIKSGFTFDPPVSLTPTISNISQSTGSIGSIITLTGTNFTGATSVTFGGTTVSEFTVVSSTSIKAVLAGGATGSVSVTTPNGSATLGNFIYVLPSATAGKLADQTGNAAVHLGFPRNNFRQKTTGTINIAVVFVDFPGAAATRTPQQVFANISPGSENFLKAASYGKINVVYVPQYKWYHMSKPLSAYSSSINDSMTFNEQKAYIQEAVNLADPTFDFSNIDEIFVLANPDGALMPAQSFLGNDTQGTTAGIVADGKTFGNAITFGYTLNSSTGSSSWVSHEFGHSLGLVDLNSFSPESSDAYMGEFSLMGLISSRAPDYTAWEKWLLGWITDDQVRAVNVKGPGVVKLSPLATSGGVKLLVLPIDQATAVLVEDRRPLGYDQGIPPPGGLFVYLIDTRLTTTQATLKALPINNRTFSKLDLLLTAGKSVTYSNITVKCTALGDNDSTIEYEIK